MLWPLELPFKITFWLLTSIVLLLTVASHKLHWKTRRTFIVSSLIAFIGFIPSCAVVMRIVDARRFGLFEYASYDEVRDFRIEHFLPPFATKISLEKTFIGHRAKYKIAESDLKSYLDGLWFEHGEYSAIPRTGLGEGQQVKNEEIEEVFDGLNWPPMSNAVRYHSPVKPNGGGATYFFDQTTGVAYHRAGYW